MVAVRLITIPRVGEIYDSVDGGQKKKINRNIHLKQETKKKELSSYAGQGKNDASSSFNPLIVGSTDIGDSDVLDSVAPRRDRRGGKHSSPEGEKKRTRGARGRA